MKTILLALTFALFLTPRPCAWAEFNLGSPIGRTPYDAYLGPMWSVLRSAQGGQPPADEVAKLVRQSNGFRYYFNKQQPYVPQTPAETESRKSGDCKAKSLWLASKMNTRKIRFVVGKARLGSSMSHAWLIWDGPEGWLVLDPTNYGRPLNPARISSSELVPTYSYSASGKYGHQVAAAAKGAKYGDHL
jgi:hypothetical protein